MITWSAVIFQIRNSEELISLRLSRIKRTNIHSIYKINTPPMFQISQHLLVSVHEQCKTRKRKQIIIRNRCNIYDWDEVNICLFFICTGTYTHDTRCSQWNSPQEIWNNFFPSKSNQYNENVFCCPKCGLTNRKYFDVNSKRHACFYSEHVP